MNRSVPRNSFEKNVPVESPEHAPEVLEVVVRPGKRFVFSEGKADAASIDAGRTARGEVDRSGTIAYVVFPEHDNARVRLETLQDRWDREIVDVWRLSGKKRIGEFF